MARPEGTTSKRLAVTILCALTAATAVPVMPREARADVEALEAQRDEANARADEAGASRAEAASRAGAAEAASAAAADAASATQAQMAEASARLDELFAELERAEAELSKAVFDLDQTRGQIAELEGRIRQNEAYLAEQQDNLAAQMSSSYKSGPAHLLETVLEATSFDDFVTRVLYANKVSEMFSDTIESIKAVKARLDGQHKDLLALEATQAELVELNEQKAEEARAVEEAQQAYLAQLSDELVAALDAARAAEAEAALARAQEAEFAAAEEAARSEATQAQEQADAERAAEEAARAARAAAAAAGIDVDVAPIASVATGDQRAIAVNSALSQVGLPYLWGQERPGVGFDCNSLTHWAWAQAGVSIPYASGHYCYGQYQWLRASGRWVYSVGELQPGDLVFYSYDGGATTYHVAMYIGGGQVVHANGYRYGVTVSDINLDSGFCGGGSPV